MKLTDMTLEKMHVLIREQLEAKQDMWAVLIALDINI